MPARRKPTTSRPTEASQEALEGALRALLALPATPPLLDALKALEALVAGEAERGRLGWRARAQLAGEVREAIRGIEDFDG